MTEATSSSFVASNTTRNMAASKTDAAGRYGNQPASKGPAANRQSFDNDEFMAAAIGDTAWLKQSLRSGRDPAQYDRNGLAAIHLASLHGRLECLKLLVEKYRVDVDLPSTTGWRPLHLAINSRTGKRSLQCLQYLLDHGADPSLVNDDEFTPAHQAAIEGNVRCLEALIKSKAAIHLPDDKGHLPLDYAKIWGHRKCARILASESWRQGKDYQAGEMQKLKQLRTLKESDDKDIEESQLAEKEFYGSLSFTNWLSDRGLEPKPIGPPLKRVSKPDMMTYSRDEADRGKNGTYKANSMAAGRQRNATTVTGKGPVTGKVQPKGPKAEGASSLRPDQTKRGETSRGKDKAKAPRVHVAFVDQPQKLDSARIPDLPREVVERVVEQRPSPHERPLEFKCKNIIDAQHRRLFNDDAKTQSEMYAHISDCLDSKLFPGSGGGRAPVESQASSRHSHDSSELDLERVTKMMKDLSRPSRFPTIEGHSYKYPFEVM